MSTSHSHVMFMFPGQGAQYRGMGSDLYQEFEPARRVFDSANEALGFDLREVCFEDPRRELNLTRFTQPALLTHHVAAMESFRQLTGNRVAVHTAGGHSLGEYSALVASGALAFEDALGLVRTRGELMGTYGEGEMIAFPMDLDTVRPLADKYYCGIAACNLSDQTVVGGRSEDLDDLAVEFERLHPRKRFARLKTEGAFHTYYMVKAAQHFRPSLDTAQVQPPEARVLSNYTGSFHEDDVGIVKSHLFFQLFFPVQWVQCLHAAVDGGVDTIIEFGGGIGKGERPSEMRPNLEGIVRKAFRGSDSPPRYYAAINVETLESTAAALA